jgi:PAS domain S-box-containing protein
MTFDALHIGLLIAALAGAAGAIGYRNKLKKCRSEIDALQHSSSDSDARYRILTENLAAAVVIRDAQGKLLYCSPFTEVLFGYPLSEIYNSEQDFFESTAHPEDLEKYRRSLKVSNLGEAFQFRYRFLHRSGLEMWAESRTVPIIDRDGTPLSSLSILFDVTGTVRYQKQVEDKSRDLQDFTYMVSHDLKAPIFSMKGMLAILEEDFAGNLPADAKEPFEHLKRAANRLEELVLSVLEFSRATSIEIASEPVDLNHVCTEVIKDFAPQISAAQAVVQKSADLPTVFGDRLKLVQVFSNLVGNAIKYRSKSRPLIIDISARPAPLKQVRICIQDNGVGIPASKTDSIFRPFQRLHGQDIEGTGIGLACVKKLMEKMGGDVQASSDGVSGSSFLLSFRSA